MAHQPSVPEALHHVYGILLGKLGEALTTYTEAALAHYGITLRHYSILALVEKQPAASQLELGQALFIDRTTMVRLLDELVERGLVQRERHPDDRRQQQVLLTPDGQGAMTTFHALVRQAEQQFLAIIPPIEQRHLRHLVLTLLKYDEY